jgi:hypothetical protein
VEEFHGQLKIGGGKKRVLLDWRENGKRRSWSYLLLSVQVHTTTHCRFGPLNLLRPALLSLNKMLEYDYEYHHENHLMSKAHMIFDQTS